MTGTRLALVLAYLVQTILLVHVSILNSCKQSGKSTWYNYRSHQSLLPVRSGTHLLENLQTSIGEMKSLILSTTIKLRVELCFSEAFTDDDQISTLSVLKSAFSVPRSTITSLEFILGSSICIDSNTNRKKDNPSNLYQLYFSMDQMLSEIKYHAKLDVSDEGQMFFRVKAGLHQDDYFNLIRNDLTFSLNHMLLRNEVVRVPGTKITVTLVDSDPLSNMISNENNSTDINHQTILLDSFMHEMNNTLSEMVYSRLNLYRSFSLKTQTYNWFGFDLTANAQDVYDSNGNRLHVLHTDDATTLLMEGDLSRLIHGSIIPFHEDFGLSGSINCIVFVPEASCTPFFFINGDKQSQAISLEKKHTIFSIVNIEQSSVKFDVGSYNNGIHQSLSLIGGFIRHEVGLHEIQSDHTIGNLHVHYENGHGGIRLWEIENLIRGSFHSDAVKVLESLERVVDLIFVRKGISVPLETSQRIVNCTDILHQALHTISSEPNDLSSSNQWIKEAMILSSQIISDDELFELPHVPLDQMFAVFGSLLLPLFLPLIKNLAAELKRYKSYKARRTL
jgi:hypothetical protein